MFHGAAINVDVDSLHHYYRIHGLDESGATNAVWEKGVTRFAELFAELGVHATFFVVTEDLERWPRARAIAEELVKAGHELGSHSVTHPYDLVRQHDKAVGDELGRSRAVLSEVRGSPCVGFRAPGYTMTPRVLAKVRETGYRYDSSIFPCPPYYLAKLARLGAMLVRGKRSRSIVGPPSVMWEERLPHRRDGLVEIPVTVLPTFPTARFPIIGTSLLMMRERGYAVV
ncbi:MAG: polysaccharide deacetylase family protein [Myxococcota bacterium]